MSLSKTFRPRNCGPTSSRAGRWLGLGVLVALAILFVVPDRTNAQTEQSIVVLVNDDPISAYDIEQRERFLAVTAHEQPGAALKKKATDMLIDERLQLQQGKKLGITSDDANVNKILGDMAQKNNLTPDGLGAARPDGRKYQDAERTHSRPAGLAGRRASQVPTRSHGRRRRGRQGDC